MADSSYMPKVYKKNGGDTLVVADGGVVQFESGATLQLDSGSIATLADEILAAGDIALAEGSVFVGNASGAASAVDAKTTGRILVGDGTTIASVAVSGDVTLAKTGAVTIAAKAVENTMIAAAAGTVLVGTKTSGDVTALDISAKGALPIGQGAGETVKAYVPNGDVVMSEAGLMTIQAKAVENTMIALAAGTIAVGTKTSGDVTALDISAKGAIPVGQGAGETAAAKTLSGDVTMDETGAVTIGAKAVENIMIAAAAGTILVGTKTSGDVTALDISAEGALPIGQGAGETAKAYALSGDVTMSKAGVTTLAKINSGAAAGTGVVAAEYGHGNFKTTLLTLTDTPVVLADNAGVIAYGGLKVYDFPQSYIYIQSAVADLAITKSSAGVNADWDGDIGVGTVTATNDAGPLAGTEQNIIPNTSTPQAVAGATTGDAVSTAVEHAILDGTGTAIDAYVNVLVDDLDHDVAGTPCNLILNGTIRLNWIFMGDN